MAGVFKLLLFIVFFCGFFAAAVSKESSGLAWSGCMIFVIGIWWLVDWIRTLAGAFKDGYGATLTEFPDYYKNYNELT